MNRGVNKKRGAIGPPDYTGFIGKIRHRIPQKRGIFAYTLGIDFLFTPGRLLLAWGSADGGKRGCTPLPSFSRNASAKLRRPRQNSPIPPRRLVCAAALPPSPYTKKREEALAAARLKKSDFVNKKSPSARGTKETVALRARG